MDGAETVTRPALPSGFARRHGIVVKPGDGALHVVAREDVAPQAIQEAQRVLGQPFTLAFCAPDAFLSLIEQVYGGSGASDNLSNLGAMDLEVIGTSSAVTDLLDDSAKAPVIELINTLFRQALHRKASDMHVEGMETGLRVRMRIDGVLQSVLERSDIATSVVISRLKVMADLNIAEARRPQDGRIALRFGGRSVDVRVSTMPGKNGERVVLRILDKSTGMLSLDAIGLEPRQQDTIQRVAKSSNGLLLVTGPTGSGKTTTLYGVIQHLNKLGTNILTVEDPVEYDLPGIGQTQVNSKIDMTFANALRAILRQDPDIVLVGEIRDGETADVAIQAALTGHLVLSTLHTNSALGAVTRLRDLGVEPFLLATTLRCAIAQRLVRRLCSECKQTVPTPATARAAFDSLAMAAPPQICEPVGCPACDGIGYSGRMGIYEIAENSPKLRELIHADATEEVLVKQAIAPENRLFAAGLRAVARHETSMEEVLRSVSAD
ncbi:GspE/PulE family protein (plasmid) [Marinovum sp. KMM 9989]